MHCVIAKSVEEGGIHHDMLFFVIVACCAFVAAKQKAIKWTGKGQKVPLNSSHYERIYCNTVVNWIDLWQPWPW